MSDSYYIQRGQKTIGPFTTAKIQDAIRANKITSEDRASINRDGPWTSLGLLQPKWFQAAVDEEKGISDEMFAAYVDSLPEQSLHDEPTNSGSRPSAALAADEDSPQLAYLSNVRSRSCYSLARITHMVLVVLALLGLILFTASQIDRGNPVPGIILIVVVILEAFLFTAFLDIADVVVDMGLRAQTKAASSTSDK